jgi:hypothetical protein
MENKPQKERPVPQSPNLSITIHPSHSHLWAIVGMARVAIDNRILLKEIPIFHWAGEYTCMMEANPVAACPEKMDLTMVNEIVWSLRAVIEMAVVEEVKRLKNGTR